MGLVRFNRRFYLVKGDQNHFIAKFRKVFSIIKCNLWDRFLQKRFDLH